MDPAPEVARDRQWALLVAVAAMAITMLPFLFGWSLLGASPQRGWFSWLGYDLDDSCVYLSWMRQAADGHFFERNLFTTQPQIGHEFNVFFLALGWLAALTHLPLLAIFHIARIVLGIALLRAVWWLIEMLVPDRRARRVSYLMVCFAAGLGWVPGLWHDHGLIKPVDAWQPEAITFLCLYQSPLFLVALLLMAGVLGGLWQGERTHRWPPVLMAAGSGLLLGDIHGYDVITLIAIWGAFLVARTIVERRFDAAAWGRAIVVGAVTGVSTGYMYWLLKHEQVFAKRVAVPTMSPDLSYYLLGYGLLVPLAIWGAALAWRARDRGDRSASNAPLFLCVWAIVNMAVAYAPLSFQRKLLMGEHLPIAILAGIGLARLLRPLEGRVRVAALAGITVLLGLTNVRFMLRDASNFVANRAQSTVHRPYMYAGEVAALEWVREHAPAGAAFQPLPWIVATPDDKIAFFDVTLACFGPGLTDHPVNAGHWGETPDFPHTMGQWVHFELPTTPDLWREDLLRSAGVRYVIFSQKHDETGDPASDARLLATFRGGPLPPFLRLIPDASNADADVYEVDLPH